VFIIIVLDLFVNSICGYALAKFDFVGKELLLTIVISLMVLPMESIILPLYKQVADFGWVNQYAGLIVPFIAKCFSIYMFRQFFVDIPNELLEAASIDGSGPIKTFFNIVVPISGTVYATIFILDFVAHWNDFMWPLIVNTTTTKMTLAPALSTLQGQHTNDYPAQMAGAVLAVIPMVVLFFVFQKQFIEGVAHTGVKG